MSNIAISELQQTTNSVDNGDYLLISKDNGNGSYTSVKITGAKLKESIATKILDYTTCQKYSFGSTESSIEVDKNGLCIVVPSTTSDNPITYVKLNDTILVAATTYNSTNAMKVVFYTRPSFQYDNNTLTTKYIKTFEFCAGDIITYKGGVGSYLYIVYYR